MYTANAVVFHFPDLKYFPYEEKPEGQIWVAWSRESDINYPVLRNPEIMEYFDLKMTYHLNSDIPDTYLFKKYQEKLLQPPTEKQYGINAFISSPFNKSGRLGYLKELMEYLEVDSYGRAFNNKKLKNDTGRDAKEELIRKYKFTIAFENSIARDYVTEKFFQPLVAGSVPIYLGAPNIDDFAPGENCFINVADFKGPKALAKYMKMLDADDALYNEYLEWKKKPFLPKFNSLLNIAGEHPIIRLCKMIERMNYD